MAIRAFLFAFWLIAFISLVVSPAAGARDLPARTTFILSDAKLGSSTEELTQQRGYARYLIRFYTEGRGAWMPQRRHVTCMEVKGRPRDLCFHARAMLRTEHVMLTHALRRLELRARVVRRLEARLAAKERQRAADAAQAAAAAALPAHHNLWMCIHSREAGSWGDPDSGGNGHYGGLQMHPGWGHGTAYYASESSQATQEQAAEEGYRESGYSRSWLLGQWYHPECLGYA
jgi:hypothetical protein